MKPKTSIATLTLATLAVVGSSALGQTARQWTPANTGTRNWNLAGNWGTSIPDTTGEKGVLGAASGANRLLNSTSYTVTQDMATLNIGGLDVNLSGTATAFSSGGTSGTNTVTVANGANFRIGDAIVGSGLASGTTVSNVVGNALTLSNNFSSNATGSYTPSNFGTSVTISGNAFAFSNTTNAFVIHKGSDGATNFVNVSTDVTLGSGTTTITGVRQGSTAVTDGTNFTGIYSGPGNVTVTDRNVTLNQAGNAQSGTWTVASSNNLTLASHSLGTASYKLTAPTGTGNTSQFIFTDTSSFSTSRLIADNGAAWSQNLTTGQGSAGLSVQGGVTATFSNFEVGGTAGNGALTLIRGGAGTATYKITDSDYSPNASIRWENATLDFANTSGVQTIGGGLSRASAADVGLTRSGVGGTTILTKSASYTGTTTVTGGTLLVNNGLTSPTTNASFSVTTTNASRLITGSNTTGMVVGQAISGTGIAGNSFVTSIIDGTQFTVNANANATGTNNVTLAANSGTGTGNVNVTGGTLGGSGMITPGGSNKITIGAGAILSPGGNASGNTVDTLVINGVNTTTANVLTMTTDAIFAWDISGSGTASDQVAFWNYNSTDLLLNNNKINLSMTGAPLAGNYVATLFKFYSDNGTSLMASGLSSGLVIGSLTGSFSGTPTFDYSTTGEIRLNYTAVPEPGNALVVLLLTAGALRRKRASLS